MVKRKLEDWLTAYLEYTERDETEPLLKAWCGIFTLAATLSRKVWILHERKIFPNNYITLVGPPGARKGTALDPVGRLLNSLGIDMTVGAVTPARLWQKISESTVSIKEFPALHAWEVVHKSYGCSAISPHVVVSEELTEFTQKNPDNLFPTLCTIYDSKDFWTADTKTCGCADAPGICLNILGATTPKELSEKWPSSAIDGGFGSRNMFVWSDDTTKITLEPTKTEKEQRIFDKLATDLKQIYNLGGQFEKTDSWREKYDAFYTEMRLGRHGMGPKYQYYLNRRQTHLMKVAMAMAVSMGDGLKLTDTTFVRAERIILETEKGMTNVFKHFGRIDTVDVKDKILKHVAGKGSCSLGELWVLFQGDLTRDELDETLAMYEEVKMIRRFENEGSKWIAFTPERAQKYRHKWTQKRKDLAENQDG